MASDGRLEFDASIDKTQLKKDVSDIQKDINKVKKEKIEVKAELRVSAEHDQDYFKEAIKDYKQQADEASKELQKAQSTLLKLKEDSKDPGFTNNPVYYEELEKARSLIKKLKKDIETANQGIADNTAWLEERKEIDATNKKIDALKEKIASLKTIGTDDDSSVFKKLEFDLAQAEGKLNGLTKGVDDTASRVDVVKSKWEKVAQAAEEAKEASNFDKEIISATEKIISLQQKMEKFKDLGGDTNSSSFRRMQIDLAEAEGKFNEFVDGTNDAASRVEALKQEWESVDNAIRQAKEAESQSKELDAAIQKVDELQRKIEKFKMSGGNTDSTTFKKMQLDLAQAEGNLDRLKTGTDTTKEKVENLKTSWEQVANATSNASKSVSNGFGNRAPAAISKTSKSMSRLLTMMKFMMIRKMINAIIKSFQEGFQQLSRYSPDVNKSISSVMSSLSQLKYGFAAAFAPLVSIVTPVINQICSAINTLLVSLSKLFAFLTGKNTFIVAKKQQKDYAKSLGGTSSAAKDAEKSLAGFDEINQLNLSKNDNSGGGGSSVNPNDLFETKDLGEMGEWAKKIKALWDDVVQVFNNLAAAFKKAWNTAGNGERIMKSLSNYANIIYNGLKKCTEATVEWSANLDLSPLLSAIARLLESFEPILQKIVDLGAFIYTEIILPIATWLLESAIPAVLDDIAGALDVINACLESIQPVLQTLWNDVINPLFTFLGDVVVTILEQLSIWLENIAAWITEHETLVQSVIVILGSLVVAFELVMGALNLVFISAKTVNSVMNVMSGVLTFLKSPIGLVVLAIGALIAILVLLVMHWDEVKKWAVDTWNTICATFNAAGTWFDEHVLTPLKDGFKGFVNTVIGWAEGLANGIVSGIEWAINHVVDMINSISFDVPDWVPFVGGSHFGVSLSHVSFDRVSIPRLATGTVVPPNAGEFAAILGDNKRETEVVSPISTMKQALIEALQEYGVSREIILQVNGDLGALVRLLKIELSNEEKRKGTRLVTV